MRINQIRVKDIHNVVELIGEVCSIREPEHIIIGIKWECPACGTLLTTRPSIEDKKTYPPYRCPCGRKHNFRMISQEVTDIRKIKIKEFEGIIGISIPVSVWLSENLIDENIKRGDKIKFKGTIILSKREQNHYSLIANEILKLNPL